MSRSRKIKYVSKNSESSNSSSSSDNNSSEDDDGITWFDPLYDFDNNDRLRVAHIGYSKGIYHSKSGLVYLKSGKPGNLTYRETKVKTNTRSTSLLEAAKTRATQEWENKQRNDTYRVSKTVPTCTVEEWRAKDTRRWPSLCMNFKNVKKERIPCTKKKPFYGQPKYNGNRILAYFDDDEEVILISRRAKEKEFLDIQKKECGKVLKKLTSLYPDLESPALDGEMYDPDVKFQYTLSKMSRTKNKHEDEDAIMYAIFDLQVYDIPFSKRLEMLEALKPYVEKRCPHIFISETVKLTDEAEIYAYREKCEKDGFEEGIVLRRGKHLYTRLKDERTLDMLKFKKIEDAEYKVVGFEEATGDHEGCVVWKLQDPNDEDIEFNCYHKCDLEEKRRFFQNGKKYIGRLLTVQYSEFSDKGVPIFPIGIAFRDEDDLPLPEKKKKKKNKKTESSSD